MKEIERVSGTQLDPADRGGVQACGGCRAGMARSASRFAGTQPDAMGAQVARSLIGSMTYLAPVGRIDDWRSQPGAAGVDCRVHRFESGAADPGPGTGITAGRPGAGGHPGCKHQSVARRWMAEVREPHALVSDILIATGLADPESLRKAGPGELLSIGEDYSTLAARKFGEILLEHGRATVEQLDAAARDAVPEWQAPGQDPGRERHHHRHPSCSMRWGASSACRI